MTYIRPYTHFRYIAYQVPTVGEARNPANPNYPFLEMPSGAGLAQALNRPEINAIPNADARERVARFYLVLSRAANRINALGGNHRNTLKVFIAPEFYFRPTTAAGGNGPAYTYVEYRAIKTALRALTAETIVQQGVQGVIPTYRFQDWLIIPGTIMWEGTNNQMGQRPPTADRVYFNTCPYIKIGGWTGDGAAVEKEMASAIDGLPTGRHGVPALPPNIIPGVGGGNPKATNEVWTIYQTPAKKKKHVFEHYGTYCGLEICLEHGMGLLKDVFSDLTNWKHTFGTRRAISLQLITAGGMTIDEQYVAVKDGGYVLRNDGLFHLNQQNNQVDQVSIEQVVRYVGDTFPPLVQVSYGHKPSYAEFRNNLIPVNNPPDITNIPNNEAVPQPAGGDPRRNMPQRIIIYPRLPLV